MRRWNPFPVGAYVHAGHFTAWHGLVLAYLAERDADNCVSLAKRMFSLWPNDNMGSRFIIADPYGTDRISIDGPLAKAAAY